MPNNDDSRRRDEFLASVDVLEANAWIMKASNVEQALEEESLANAKTALDRARGRLTEPLALAVVDANEAGSPPSRRSPMTAA